MESNLANKLKLALDKMSKEEVIQSWESVRKMNLKGPTLNQAILYIDYIHIDESHSFFDFSDIEFDTYQPIESNFNTAA